MSRRGVHRRLVALLAAYGLALHGLLSTFAAGSPVLAFDAPLCSHASAEQHGGSGKRLPAHDSACTLCPFMCGTAGPLPSFDAKLALPVLTGAAPLPARPAVPVARAVVHAGLARAPPA